MKPTDDPARYLAVAICTAIALLGAVVASNIIAKWCLEITEPGQILRYQVSKIANATGIDTIFVGDSSLGNAISAAQFDALAHTHSLNLALNGNFGYGGSYNMIRRALNRGFALKNVIVVQSAYILMRPASYRGFVLSAPDANLDGLPLQMKLRMTSALSGELLDSHTAKPILRYFSGQRLQFTNDYVRQHPRIRTRRDPIPASALDPSDTVFLHLIVDLCRSRHLNCIYAFGPMVVDELSRSQAFIDAACEQIRRTGIPIAVGEPMPIPEAALGNSEDHVAPQYKPVATQYYAERIVPWLMPKARK